MFELNSAYFLSAQGLAYQACLMKTGIKFELLADICYILYTGIYYMLVMVEKGIRGGMCHVIY